MTTAELWGLVERLKKQNEIQANLIKTLEKELYKQVKEGEKA